MLGGLVLMMGRMQSMGVGHVSVMSGLLVVAGFIMLGRFTMMMRGALVVIGGGLVMLAALVRLRAHIAVLLLGALTAKRLLPKSDTRVNGRSHRLQTEDDGVDDDERHRHALGARIVHESSEPGAHGS
jgi:hypothetical protein